MDADQWSWCKRCEQCYLTDWEGGRWGMADATICPYWECDNDLGEIVAWHRIRRLHPEFPRIPEPATRYHVDGWLWCESCTRCFKFDVDGEHCPYQDCERSTHKNAWPWWRIRTDHPEYPEVPRRGSRYRREQVKAGEELAIRRTSVGENRFDLSRDLAKAHEVVCPECRTINPKSRNRCFYCSELLPGPKKRGRDLRLGLSWNHPSGLPVVFRG